MNRIVKLTVLYVLVIIASQPVLAGDVTEPEVFEVADAYLTSESQDGVAFHVMKACQDESMTTDCTQCIFRAKSDGAVWIPANNRCIYRLMDQTFYTLYYQIKASTSDGLESGWTIPRKVTVNRGFRNFETNSSYYTVINYDTQADFYE